MKSVYFTAIRAAVTRIATVGANKSNNSMNNNSRSEQEQQQQE
jgi:hypothetical protein